jgi:hypothetical protein
MRACARETEITSSINYKPSFFLNVWSPQFNVGAAIDIINLILFSQVCYTLWAALLTDLLFYDIP